MSIQVDTTPAQAKVDGLRAHLGLTTPEPVYVVANTTPERKPAALGRHDHTRALAAIHHAKAHYPGVVGEVLAEAIEAHKDLGYLADPGSRIKRLIDELMGPPS